MTPELLIQNIKREIESLVSLYSEGARGGTEVGIKLDSLGLDQEVKERVLNLIHQSINEYTYNLICGFEGEASLAGTQEAYAITDESGNKLSGNLAALYYEQVME